jgi:hypothetical protein
MDHAMTQTPNPPPLGAPELEFATFHEGYVSRYIQLADAKAGTALVVTGGVLGYLLGQDGFVAELTLRSGYWEAALAIAAGLALAVSAVLCFAVIAPRGSKPGTSLVYFGDVARRQTADFVDAVRTAGVDGLVRERLGHTHAISGICRRKYGLLRVALGSGAAGLVAALVWRFAH